MQDNLKQLEKIFQGNYEFKNKWRAQFIALFITSLIKARSVNLSDIATVFANKSKTESNYRRIQRFFKDFTMHYITLGKMLISLMPKDRRFIVAIDRTNWKLGKKDISILMLTLVYKGISFPVCWMLLNKAENSNYKERIKSLVADREFDCQEWVTYLKDRKIPFHIRVKHTLTYNAHKKTGGKRIKKLLDKQKAYTYITYPKRVVIFKQDLYTGGKRLPDGDYLIIVSNENPEEALKD
jgi:hypothetical protein